MQSTAILGIDAGQREGYDNAERLYLSLPDLRRDPLHTSGALSNCTSPKLADQEEFPDDGMEEDDQGGDSDASDQPRRDHRAPRKPHLQGRFSGRLETKSDEKRLADECRLLGPLLGGIGKRGERSRLTLAKIVRGIASGDVRSFCEGRELAVKDLEQRRAGEEAATRQTMESIELENAKLRFEIEQVRSVAALSTPTAPKPEPIEEVAAPHLRPVRVPISMSATSSSNAMVCATSASIPPSPDKAQTMALQSPQASQLGMPFQPHHIEIATVSGSHAVPQLPHSIYSGDPGPPSPHRVLSVGTTSLGNTSMQSAEDAGEAQAFAQEAAQLQKYAQNLKAHANSWAMQSQTAFLGRPVKMQAACQAQSFQAKAVSLEKAAEAQNLQAQAVVHAQAQAKAQAQAQQYVSQGEPACTGSMENGESQQAYAEKQQLDRKAHEHAQAQTKLVTAAHSLTQKANAHMHAQVTAQQQAHAAAAEAHHYDAQAQALQAEAASVAGPIGTPALPEADPMMGMVHASNPLAAPHAMSTSMVLPMSSGLDTGGLSPSGLAAAAPLQSNLVQVSTLNMSQGGQLSIGAMGTSQALPRLPAAAPLQPPPSVLQPSPRLGHTALAPLDGPALRSVLHGLDPLPQHFGSLTGLPLDHGALPPPHPSSAPIMHDPLSGAYGPPGSLLSQAPRGLKSSMHIEELTENSHMRLVSGL